MKKLILSLYVLGCSFIVLGQNSVLQDSDGESGYKFDSGSSLTLSAGETSIGYSFVSLDSEKERGIGVNLKFQSANGVATVLDDGQFDSKGSVGAFYVTPLGGDAAKRPRILLKPYGNVGIATATLLDPNDLNSGTSSEESFTWEVGFALSRNGTINSKIPTLWGLTINTGSKDNLSNLKVLKYKGSVPIAGTNYSSESELKGYDKNAFEGQNTTFNINLDYAIFPEWFNKRMVIAGHYRHRSFDGDEVGKLGLGFYLNKDKAPTTIVGGINVLYNDLYGTLDDFTNNYSNVSINVVAGFKI